jgi:hypothetical protein
MNTHSQGQGQVGDTNLGEGQPPVQYIQLAAHWIQHPIGMV